MQACKPVVHARVLLITLQLARCRAAPSQKVKHRLDEPPHAQVSGSLDNVGGLVLQRRLVGDPLISKNFLGVHAKSDFMPESVHV